MKDSLFTGLKYGIISLFSASVLFVIFRFRYLTASYGEFSDIPDYMIYNTFLFTFPVFFFSFLFLAFLLVREYQYHFFDARKAFFSSLASELQLADQNDCELSLLLFSIEPDMYRNRESALEHTLKKHFPESSSFFPLHTMYAVIAPLCSSMDIEQKTEAAYKELKHDLDADYASFFAGITSRQKRSISPRLLYHEAKITLDLAKEEDFFCIMSFQPDPERYEELFG